MNLTKKTLSIFFIIIFSFLAFECPAQKNKLKIYSCPDSKMLTRAYRVTASGKPVPVYFAKVGAADNARRFLAVDDLMHSEEYYDTAAFCYLDMRGSATITVAINKKINAVKILPSALKIKSAINGNSVSFTVSSPQNITVEINGEVVRSLHIFINPIETNIPKFTDSNIIYFGPGIHYISSLVVGDNKTIYLAGGAVVKAIIDSTEKCGIEPSGLKNYQPSIALWGHNIKFKGRGIIDATECPTHSRNFINITGSKINLEGIILLNSPGWTVPLFRSDSVTITNIKILGYRANSDGIDICNSSNITIDKCFIRTNDDLVVIKSWEGQGESKHIIVKNCVLWNQLAHALSIGAELRENVSDVLFTNCDIIHDTGREWSLRIFHSDASLVKNIRFENLRIEESHKLISLWVGKLGISFNKEPGSIIGVGFKNISANGYPLSIELIGANEQHTISNIFFKNVILNGKLISKNNMNINPFVKNVEVSQ